MEKTNNTESIVGMCRILPLLCIVSNDCFADTNMLLSPPDYNDSAAGRWIVLTYDEFDPFCKKTKDFQEVLLWIKGEWPGFWKCFGGWIRAAPQNLMPEEYWFDVCAFH